MSHIIIPVSVVIPCASNAETLSAVLRSLFRAETWPNEILIVDDNADIRNIINELITDSGYKTRVAANYNQAIYEINKKLPDLAVVDIKLDKGDKDGIDILKLIGNFLSK